MIRANAGEQITLQLDSAPTAGVSVYVPSMVYPLLADGSEIVLADGASVSYLSVHNPAGNGSHTVTIRNRAKDENGDDVTVILITKTIAAAATLVFANDEWTVYTTA